MKALLRAIGVIATVLLMATTIRIGPSNTVAEQAVDVEGFVEAIAHVALQFDPGFDATTIEQRPSKAGNYLGLTITITATSREQLDELYRTLTTHPMVKVVL